MPWGPKGYIEGRVPTSFVVAWPYLLHRISLSLMEKWSLHNSSAVYRAIPSHTQIYICTSCASKSLMTVISRLCLWTWFIFHFMNDIHFKIWSLWSCVFFLEWKPPEKPAKPLHISVKHVKLFLRKLNKEWFQKHDLALLSIWSLLKEWACRSSHGADGKEEQWPHYYTALFKLTCSRGASDFCYIYIPSPLLPLPPPASQFFHHHGHVWEFNQQNDEMTGMWWWILTAWCGAGTNCK